MEEGGPIDFEAAGLLDGLEGEERAGRLRLLERLAAEGVGLEDLQTAVAEDRLALLPVERLLGGHLTAREIEARTGLPASTLMRLRRLTGLPEAAAEDPVFAEEEVTAARALRVFLEAGFEENTIAEITRVLGEGMARLAATTAAAFAERFLEPGDTEEEVAARFAALAEQLTPALTPLVVAALRAHLHAAAGRAMLGREVLESGQIAGTQELSVAFADLVGFTRLGSRLDVEELGTMAGRLATLAAEVADGPVRLVKTIGDAAMFVSTDSRSLVAAALTLVEAGQEAELPALRVGIARGLAQQRAGDFYGHAVNLASRVTGAARPGTVLCTEDIREAAEDAFAWSFAGRHHLKGIRQTVALHRVRRRVESEPAPPLRLRSGRERSRG